MFFNDDCKNFEERGEELFVEKFREIFRKFGCIVRELFYYRFKLVLICDKVYLLSFL